MVSFSDPPVSMSTALKLMVSGLLHSNGHSIEGHTCLDIARRFEKNHGICSVVVVRAFVREANASNSEVTRSLGREQVSFVWGLNKRERVCIVEVLRE